MYGRTSEQYTPIGLINNGDGTVDIYAVAHAALSVGTLYAVQGGQYGWKTVAIGNVAEPMFVGTPLEAAASGDVARIRVGGYVEDITTASLDLDPGDYVDVSGGATADGGTTKSEASFAVATADDGGTATTVHSLMLLGREIVSAST
jgi:hypothetical protein